MNAFLRAALFLSAGFSLSASAAPASAPRLPVVSGPFVELRAAPTFEAPTQKLAPTWGPAIPVGTSFRVEKTYGRWLFGTPAPLPHMPTAQDAKPGWVFSRTLLLPGDEDTIPPAQNQLARAVVFHGRQAWEKLGLGKPPLVSSLDFYEGLTLSKGTLEAFRQQDEAPLTWLRLELPLLPDLFFHTYPVAHAEGEPSEKEPSLGLSGTDLHFLDQEFEIRKAESAAQARARNAKKIHVPHAPAIDDKVRTALLGRFLLEKYLDRPPLTHEEVDGYIYMRATAMRALRGCPVSVQNYWKGRRWNFFRVYRLKSRPEVPHPWLVLSLPGGYYAVSGRAIELAGNEAELAYLLVRALVREPRLERHPVKFSAKAWPQQLQPLSEEIWSEVLRSQSTKDSDNLDVADEIAVDLTTLECLSRAGYRPGAGLSYLRKLNAQKDESWATWFRENAIGLDYRLERVSGLLTEFLAQKKFPEGQVTNPKRFSTAARHWNVLP